MKIHQKPCTMRCSYVSKEWFLHTRSSCIFIFLLLFFGGGESKHIANDTRVSYLRQMIPQWILFSLHPIHIGYETLNQFKRINKPKWCPQLLLPYDVWSSYKYLISCQSKDSCAHEVVIQVLPIMMNVESRMVSIFRARSPFSFIHVSFWCQFLDPHLTTYH